MIFADKFSTLLKHYRQQKKLTQQELAEMINVGVRTYQRLETGEANPTIEVLLKLSEVLNFKFSEIFHYEEEKSKEYLILEQSAQLLRNATRMAKVGAWQYDLNSKHLYWSDTTKYIHEVGENYFPDFESMINFFKEGHDRNEIHSAIETCMQIGKPCRKELNLITATGKALRVIAQGEAEFVDGQCQRIFGTIQDVTEIRQKEKNLADALKELIEIQSFAGIGRWQLDISENKLEWSESMFQIFDLDPKTFNASYEAFLDLVHPDDRDGVNEAYTNSLKTREPYEIQHRLLMKDGRIKWVQEKCRTSFSENGLPLMSIGYTLDITKYKN